MPDGFAMIKGRKVRHADFAIEPTLLDRWSPRVMSGGNISRDELMAFVAIFARFIPVARSANRRPFPFRRA